MINEDRLQSLLLAYAEEVKMFFYAYGLAHLVVDVPVDHVAIKALNRATYEQYLNIYFPLSKQISYAHINERDLATAVLQKPLDAGTFGTVEMIEIMEPKPEVIPTTHDIIDHIELLVPNLEIIKQALTDKDVDFKIQTNINHTGVVVELNEWGQEIKFTDRSLADITATEIKTGKGTIMTKQFELNE